MKIPNLKLQEVLFNCKDPKNPFEVLTTIIEDYGHIEGYTYDDTNHQELNITMYDEDMYEYLYEHRFDFPCINLKVHMLRPETNIKINIYPKYDKY